MLERNLIFTLDSYKDLHDQMLEPNTQNIDDYLESRIGAQYSYTLWFGLQIILKKWLVGNVITKQMIDEAEPACKDHFKYCGDVWSRAKWDYIVEKHGGKLPIRIRSVAEGTKVPVGNAMMRIEATDENCAWLVGPLETLLQQVWYPSAVATRSNIIVSIIKKYFKQTADDANFWLSDYYLHDFGMRACTCMEQAGIGGLAHLINSKGTDTKMAIPYAVNYYKASVLNLCHSVPASEHSIQGQLGRARQYEVTKRLIKKFPKGILSIVSDTYNIEEAVGVYCTLLKPDIMARDGKFVIRPDSPRFEGDTPANQVLWIVQQLWKYYGGTINSKNYRVLDSHIGVIYGDSLTETEIEEVLRTLKENGFSAECCVYGCGGYLLQKINRDTQRQAIKCSAQKIDGKWVDVYKEPKDKTKASKKGRLELVEVKGIHGGTITTLREEDVAEMEAALVGDKTNSIERLFKTVYENGELLVEYTLDDVRRKVGLLV